MVSQAWEYFFLALSGIVAIYIKDELFPGQDLSENWQVFIPALLAAILFFFISLMFGFCKNYYFFRVFFDPRSMFEGRWFEEYHNSNSAASGPETTPPDLSNAPSCAIFEIYYSRTDKQYTLKGYSYTSNAVLVGSWYTRLMDFNVANNNIDYFYEGDYMDERAGTKGFGYFNFKPHSEPKFKKNAEISIFKKCAYTLLLRKYLHSGMGFFVDDGNPPVRTSFTFFRLSKNNIKKTIGNANSALQEDTDRLFITTYFQKR